MPPSLKHYADYFSMGLEIGLCSQTEIAAWADRLIEPDDRPPIWAIELATSTSKHLVDVVHLLNVVPGVRNPEISLRLLIAKLGIVHPILLPEYEQFGPTAYSQLVLDRVYYQIQGRDDLSDAITESLRGLFYDIDVYQGLDGAQRDGTWLCIQQDYREMLEAVEDYKK
jgi:hypothetical protein